MSVVMWEIGTSAIKRGLSVAVATFVTSLQAKECTAGVCSYVRPISEQSVSTPGSL